MVGTLIDGKAADMRVAMASVAARAGRVNEDFTGAVPAGAVLVDGAGIPGAEALCHHGVAWYASRLGATLLALLASGPARGLRELLAEAIERVTDAHRGSCAVADPIGPSATVAMLRLSGGVLEHLVLGDAFLVLDRPDGAPIVVTDPREVVISSAYVPALEAAGQGTDAYQRILNDLRAHRNAPGGFWLAKDDPRAAREAVTGSRPIAELSGAVLLSNGAARLADEFKTGWPEVLAVLASDGPAEIIRRVRQAEARHAVRPDDATITHCTGLGEQ